MNDMVGKDLGRYHVIEALGEGGMASIYKAFDTSLERYVAIKIIRADAILGGEQAQFLARFQREAKALAQLDHPYILKVLDYGEQAGIPYLVMPFVEGGTLKGKMGCAMPYQEAAALLAPIARALEYAHQLNIIHRDVKPANILIARSGAPILSDFGIAKMLEAGESTQLTGTGVGIGTPDYMAPEQWMGKAVSYSDMYSLGIVFFQMITGRLPFSADTPAAVLMKQIQDPLPRPGLFVPGLPESVEQVLFKALAKEPENRFPNMGVFAGLLETLARNEMPTVLHVPLPAGASQATVVNPSAAHPAVAVATREAAPAPKKVAGWKIGLIGLSGFALVGLFLVLVVAAFLFIRSRSLAKPPSDNPTSAVVTQPGLPDERTAQATGAVLQSGTAAATKAATQVTPFLSIKNFPEDIPILTDNNGDLMTTTTGSAADNSAYTIYMFSTQLSAQQVEDFYKNGMTQNGWTFLNSTSGNDMLSYAFSKGDTRMVQISIISSQDKPGQQVMIMVQ